MLQGPLSGVFRGSPLYPPCRVVQDAVSGDDLRGGLGHDLGDVRRCWLTAGSDDLVAKVRGKKLLIGPRSTEALARSPVSLPDELDQLLWVHRAPLPSRARRKRNSQAMGRAPGPGDRRNRDRPGSGIGVTPQ